MRLIIELKRDANPCNVLNHLYKHTPLQLAFNANIVALVDGQPRTAAEDDPPALHRVAARSFAGAPSSTCARHETVRISSTAKIVALTTSTR